MFTRVVNLLTFKGLLSRVRRGKGKRRDQPRTKNPKPHQSIRTKNIPRKKIGPLALLVQNGPTPTPHMLWLLLKQPQFWEPKLHRFWPFQSAVSLILNDLQQNGNRSRFPNSSSTNPNTSLTHHWTRLALRHKPVAHGGFGENEFRPGRVGFDLFAQVRDMDPEIMCLFHSFCPPTSVRSCRCVSTLPA